MKNYYEILEASFNASLEEIKKAFRIKAVKYHPDKHLGDAYFAAKFIEAKEAYDTLSDSNRKAEYDIRYREMFIKEESQRQQAVYEKRRQEKEQEEQFHYNPYKSFYSFKDRTQQETPQFKPKINHWGEPLTNNAEFFALPKNIGKIITGFTTLSSKIKPPSQKETSLKYVKFVLIAVAISLFLIFAFSVQNPIWIGIWILVPFALFLRIAYIGTWFRHACNFIGVNGFAEYKCQDRPDNIVSSYEINFNDITDMIKVVVVQKVNFNYSGTDYSFVWFKGSKVVKEVNGSHRSKDDNPDRTETSFWLNTWAERYWTVYLLDKMESELEKRGYIQFNLYGHKVDNYRQIPYIHLGIGYIKFLTAKGNVIYNFNEIKRVYTKGTNVFIEHSNYEKKFFFFESGNKNGIPLTNLSNRQFFFRAIELLLGYKFS